MDAEESRSEVKKSNSFYVMYGYCLSDIEKTAYLKNIPTLSTDANALTDEVKHAMRFAETNVTNKKGFGTPKQWLKLVNDEFAELFGKDAYKFHLVKRTS